MDLKQYMHKAFIIPKIALLGILQVSTSYAATCTDPGRVLESIVSLCTDKLVTSDPKNECENRWLKLGETTYQHCVMKTTGLGAKICMKSSNGLFQVPKCTIEAQKPNTENNYMSDPNTKKKLRPATSQTRS